LSASSCRDAPASSWLRAAGKPPEPRGGTKHGHAPRECRRRVALGFTVMEQEGAGTGRHRAVLLASREEQGRGWKGGRRRACAVRHVARHACARRPGAAACWWRLGGRSGIDFMIWRGCIYTKACWAGPFPSNYWASSLTSVISVNRA
jgi:hypothetical protein